MLAALSSDRMDGAPIIETDQGSETSSAVIVGGDEETRRDVQRRFRLEGVGDEESDKTGRNGITIVSPSEDPCSRRCRYGCFSSRYVRGRSPEPLRYRVSLPCSFSGSPASYVGGEASPHAATEEAAAAVRP